MGVVWQKKLAHGSLRFPAWISPRLPIQTQNGVGVITLASATDTSFPLKALVFLSTNVYMYKLVLCSASFRETPCCSVEGHCLFNVQARKGPVECLPTSLL